MIPSKKQDNETELCPYCAGSGEGYVDGSRCRHCKGGGEVPRMDEDEEYCDEDAYWAECKRDADKDRPKEDY